MSHLIGCFLSCVVKSRLDRKVGSRSSSAVDRHWLKMVLFVILIVLTHLDYFEVHYRIPCQYVDWMLWVLGE